MKKEMILLFVVFMSTVILISVSHAESPEKLNLQNKYNCSEETIPLIIKISELNQTISSLKSDLTYYKNLSNYYRGMYESKELNITHKELINIYNTFNNFQSNITQINKRINNIQKEFRLFTFKFGFSIISGVTFIEIILFYLRRKKKNE